MWHHEGPRLSGEGDALLASFPAPPLMWHRSVCSQTDLNDVGGVGACVDDGSEGTFARTVVGQLCLSPHAPPTRLAGVPPHQWQSSLKALRAHLPPMSASRQGKWKMSGRKHLLLPFVRPIGIQGCIPMCCSL